MSDECCGTCAHWKLWPPLDTRKRIKLCLAPLPSWVYASGAQQTRSTDGTNCDAWEAKQ